MYQGWIIFPDENELAGKIIIDCEIFLKEKDDLGAYNCELTDIGMEKLDKYWGDAYWGLTKVKEDMRK